MNSIETLKRDIERALSGVETKLRKPRKDSGNWWLDARHNGHVVTVEWSPRRGFGVSTDDLEDGYGEGPDEVISDRNAAAARVVELLVKGTRSVPPHDVLLRELRAALGFTQEQLASRLGVQQAAVSRLERRPDITLGSLRRYVEALGGELEINVRTPDGEQLKLVDARPTVKARATCDHTIDALPKRSAGSERQPNISRLTEMVSWLEGTARARWSLRTPHPLTLRSSSTIPLACADLSKGAISINTQSASRLASIFSGVASRCSVFRSAAGADDEAVYRYLLAHEVGHFVLDDFPGSASPELVDAELRADAFAGWLAALAGDEPAVGSLVAGLLGCRHSKCSHPTPEGRTLAYLSGHSRGLGESARSAARMSLLVLRVADLEISRSFYAGLGLELVPERHGDGPLHYSCTMDGTVMELYASTTSNRPLSRLRLGFHARKEVFDRLSSSGLLTDPPRMIRSLPRSEVYLVRDPDENAIEVEVAA